MLRPGREYFEGIYNMRIDEVPDNLLIEYQGSVINILLDGGTWATRCNKIKKVWSEVHQTIERNRRDRTFDNKEDEN